MNQLNYQGMTNLAYTVLSCAFYLAQFKILDQLTFYTDFNIGLMIIMKSGFSSIILIVQNLFKDKDATIRSIESLRGVTNEVRLHMTLLSLTSITMLMGVYVYQSIKMPGNALIFPFASLMVPLISPHVGSIRALARTLFLVFFVCGSVIYLFDIGLSLGVLIMPMLILFSGLSADNLERKLKFFRPGVKVAPPVFTVLNQMLLTVLFVPLSYFFFDMSFDSFTQITYPILGTAVLAGILRFFTVLMYTNASKTGSDVYLRLGLLVAIVLSKYL